MRRRLAQLVAALLASSLLAAPLASAGERTAYPVPYNFLPYAVVGGTQTDAPGSNDWACRPTDRHPRPVVLVHGTFGNQSTNWQTYAPLLANNGYCVFALTYGVDPTGVPGSEKFGGMTRMQDSAAELKRFVAKVRRATGVDKVDIVGHSQGTLMPNYYVKFLGGAQLRQALRLAVAAVARHPGRRSRRRSSRPSSAPTTSPPRSASPAASSPAGRAS